MESSVVFVGLVFRVLERLGILIGSGYLLFSGCKILQYELSRRKQTPSLATVIVGAGGEPLKADEKKKPAGTPYSLSLSGLTQGALITLMGVVTLNVASFNKFTHSESEFTARGVPAPEPVFTYMNPQNVSIPQPSPVPVVPAPPTAGAQPPVSVQITSPSVPQGAGSKTASLPSASGTVDTDVNIHVKTRVVSFSGERVGLFEEFCKHLRENNKAILTGKVETKEDTKKIWKLACDHLLLLAEDQRLASQNAGAGTNQADPLLFKKVLASADQASSAERGAIWKLIVAHAELLAKVYDRDIKTLKNDGDKKVPVYEKTRDILKKFKEAEYKEIQANGNILQDRLKEVESLLAALKP